MYRVLVCFFSAVMSFGCANTSSDSAAGLGFKLISLSVGKLRREDGGWTLYEHGPDMKYSVNGSCTFGGKRIPCMWHGFMLEYDSYGRRVKLTCEVFSDVPSNYGNSQRIKRRNTSTYVYHVSLSGVRNVHVQPQFVGMAAPGTVETEETICKFNGEEVLRFTQTFSFPTKP